jgi:hypothetical protein
VPNAEFEYHTFLGASKQTCDFKIVNLEGKKQSLKGD